MEGERSLSLLIYCIMHMYTIVISSPYTVVGRTRFSFHTTVALSCCFALEIFMLALTMSRSVLTSLIGKEFYVTEQPWTLLVYHTLNSRSAFPNPVLRPPDGPHFWSV